MLGGTLLFQNGLRTRLLLCFWENFFLTAVIIVVGVVHCFVFINNLNILLLKKVLLSQ
jgi:hypothetical protein